MAEAYDAPLPWTGEIAAPLRLFRSDVRAGWLDSFDHVNIAHYLTICDHANWAFWNWINAPRGRQEDREGHEYVIVENHVHYIGELALGMSVEVSTQLLGVDDKRLILFHHVWNAGTGELAATNEVKFLAFHLGARRPEAWAAHVADRLHEIRAAHAGLQIPPQAGQGIALRRKQSVTGGQSSG
ncbi:MAG: thioesterase family protein [Pseudomonadota bacterium]